MDPELFPIPAAQQYLGGLGRTTIYELIARGLIRRVNIGRRSFITRQSMDHYIAHLAETR